MSDQLEMLLSMQTQRLLLEHGIRLIANQIIDDPEPLSAGCFKILVGHNNYSGDKDGLWHPVYKDTNQGRITYSAIPFTDLSESGFLGFLAAKHQDVLDYYQDHPEIKEMSYNQLLEWSVDKVDDILRDQNDYANYNSYSLVLTANGFKGAHIPHIWDKNQDIDRWVNLQIATMLKSAADVGVVNLIVHTDPSLGLNKSVVYQSTINLINERCGVQMLVHGHYYNDLSGSLQIQLPIWTIPNFNDLNLSHANNKLIKLSVKNLSDLFDKNNDYRSWSEDALNSLFEVILHDLNGVALRSVKKSDGVKKREHSNTSANSKTLVDPRYDDFIKHKTKKRLVAHGLSLNIENDTSAGNKGLYVIDVKVGNNWLDGEVFGCENKEGEIDKIVNKVIDDMILSINKDKQTRLIVLSVEGIKCQESELIQMIVNNAQERYGIVPVIGFTELDKKKLLLKMRLSFRSLPSFIRILDCSHRNVYMDVKNRMIALNKGSIFREVNIADHLDRLLDNHSYETWHPIMTHAFLDMLFSGTKNVTCKRIYG